MKFIIALVLTLSSFLAQAACDTRDHKEVTLKGKILSAKEEGIPVYFEVSSTTIKHGSKKFNQALLPVLEDGAPSTNGPLSEVEAKQVQNIKRYLGSVAGLLILNDKNGNEVARFFIAGGDYARCLK